MRSSFPTLNATNLKTALVEGNKVISYAALNLRCDRFASGLLNGNVSGKADLEEERIAFFMPASIDYVTTMHGIWRAGGIAVPLNVASAVTELEHYLTSASVSRMIANGDYRESLVDLCATLNIELLSVDDIITDEAATLPDIAPERRAMMLFTSGTTNKPKGVVSTHKTIAAQ
ncbi:MAG: AMP-binding protein, partial [OM182 bacterium]|nr:AMP-binding protein [OM182 bacterium]